MSEHAERLRDEAAQISAPIARKRLLDAANELERLERLYFPPSSALCTDVRTILAQLDKNDNIEEPDRSNSELGRLVKELSDRVRKIMSISKAEPKPIPLLLYCPECKGRHVDKGKFATHPHHTHSCQHCGLTWRPAVVPTVGVQFLPGFKDEE